ncbi:MAG: GTP-binding protein [Proteobacteria bacterium]|nr:GTP-binding protein [Pseudomonadota bacterium]
MEKTIDWTAFGVWLIFLLHAHGEIILRLKGILNVLDEPNPVIIHGAQHTIHPPQHLEKWPDGDERPLHPRKQSPSRQSASGGPGRPARTHLS